MTNPFKSLIPRPTMTHAAFEKTMLGFEKIRQETAKSGRQQIGNFTRGSGAVSTKAGACEKGGRRVNTAVVKDLIRYLEREKQRFDPTAVGKALTALKAVKGGKNLNLTALANDHHGLVETKVLTTDFVSARRLVREASNEAWKAADELTAGASRHVSSDSPATAKAKEQAMREQAITCGKQFSQACLSGPGQQHSKEAKRIFRWLSRELGASNLTRRIGVNALDGVVEQLEGKLRGQKTALEALLKQADTRAQEPAFHQEVKQLSEKYMESQAVYVKTLAFMANVLGVRRNPIDLPPGFRLPTAAFSQSLVNLAHALQTPGSDFMDNNQWAAQTKAAAEKRLAELNEPKAGAAAPVGHKQQVDRLRADGMEAYAKFESACLLPKAGAPSLSDEQTRLRDGITRKLIANAATKKLPLGAVKNNLFVHTPDRIQRLSGELNSHVSAWKRPGAKNRLELTRIRDVARGLDEQIDGYLAQLEAVGSILVADPQLGALTPELDATRIDAGNRMLQLHFLHTDADGDLMRIRAFARQARDDAQGELNQLSLTPAPKARGTLPRPLDSEQAHLDEEFFARQVDEMEAELLGSVFAQQVDEMAAELLASHAQDPDARRLLATPIRTIRHVDVEETQRLKMAAERKASLTADWELGRARLDPDEITGWSDELENTLSGLDEAAKRLDQPNEVRLPAARVQPSRGLTRKNASADLMKPRSPGIMPSPGPKPAVDSPFGEDDDFLLDVKAAVHGKKAVSAEEIERRDRELAQMKRWR